MTRVVVEAKTCPECESKDITYRYYGIDPQLVVIACWACHKFSTLEVPSIQEMVAYKKQEELMGGTGK